MFIEGDETRVSDGDPVGISGEIFEYSGGSGERRSGINIPLAVTKASDEAFEGTGMLEGSEFAKEAQAMLGIEREEFIEEHTTEQGGEDFDVDEEVVA